MMSPCLGGNLEDVLHHLPMGVFEEEAVEMGILLNQRKSEVICGDQSTRDAILSSFPEVSVVAKAWSGLPWP